MTLLADILCLAEKIPATFWGVVIGAFFSLTGVALTNRASDKRLRNQFKHEREQIKTDREMALRKEVYLAAAEGISAGVNAIGRFANLEVSYKDIVSEYEKRAPMIAKVPIIASAKTMEALNIFSTELGATFIRLSAPHFHLIAKKQQAIDHGNNITNSVKERERLLEIMKQYNLDGVVDARRWQILQQNFDFETQRIEEAQKERDSLIKSLYPQQLELMKECVTQMDALGKLLVPVLSAVREELELPFNEESYRQGLTNGHSKMKKTIDEFIQKVSPQQIN